MKCTFHFACVCILLSVNYSLSKKDGLNFHLPYAQVEEKKIRKVVPLSENPCFLPFEYEVKGESTSRFNVRQVPGDGGCLFHSLAVCVKFQRDKDHPPFFDLKLRELSDKLREISVKVLRSPALCLAMESGEEITSSELLKMVAANYNISETEYLQQMLIPNTWGGGPEIVALSNHFKRPIHVYELHTQGNIRKHFQLKICAKFGSPAFDAKSPLNILCADGRFPNIAPGSQKDIGDHFLALFPCSTKKATGTSKISSSSKGLKGSKWLDKIRTISDTDTDTDGSLN